MTDRAWIEDFFAAIGPVSVRPMFGGHGVYRDGLMFALEADGEFYLKVDARTEPEFAAAGSAPFVYDGKTKPVRMSYWRVPDAAIDDPAALKRWCALAVEAARRAVKPARASKPARAKRPTQKG